MHDLLNQTVEVFLVYSASGSRSLKALYTNADVKIRKTWKRSYTEFSSYIEHQLCAIRVEVDHLLLPGLVFSSLFFLLLTFYQGIGPTVVSYVAFWGTLSLWILLYRAFWHPLRHFPGPFGAKLSKLWTVKQAWDSRWDWHRVQQSLRKEI
ncbi:hypothetical protein GGP41_003398 [Bipolaris sorokiniana]|uniref:Uncharacterized protein n=1 Tax=Cochliobolus sativus TaxID=45130 RepID=A0A8H5ZFJ5_COCSA|nr:hypothetical protein GGP41_003398 [Bipolaris sorokiniana]